MRWYILFVFCMLVCDGPRGPLVVILRCVAGSECDSHEDCADDEICSVNCNCRLRSERAEEQFPCGNGRCAGREDAWNCPEDCGCQAGEEACDCGVAPGGCLCGWGCVEAGDCCPDICDGCGACGTDFLPRRGCGDGRCDSDENCAVCARDCGECDGICPPPVVFIRYRTESGAAGFGLTLWARFVTDYGVGDWERLQEIPRDLSSTRIATVISTPSRPSAIQLWTSYSWQSNGRERASCEGELADALEFGEYSVMTSGVALTHVLAAGAAGEPGNCSHSFPFQSVE